MSHSFLAGGNIAPSRFVTPSATAGQDRVVVQSGSGDRPIGISQLGTHLTPILNLDDGYAGVLGENVHVYTKDDAEGFIELGGTVAAGDLLKPDANGKGVTATADGDYYGARALVAGTSGLVIKAQMTFGYRGA